MMGKLLRQLEAARRDDGVTLIELMIVMFITSIIGGVILVAMTSIYKTETNTDNEAQGLADVRTVVERLGRDLRDARAVDPGADPSHLVLWIDLNSDYIRDPVNQPDEIVTWSLASGPSGSHYNVLRSTQGGQIRQEAHTLVSNIAFCYSADVSTDPPTCLPDTAAQGAPSGLSASDAAKVKVVTVTVTYNAAVNGTASSIKARTTTFTELLRNVG